VQPYEVRNFLVDLDRQGRIVTHVAADELKEYLHLINSADLSPPPLGLALAQGYNHLNERRYLHFFVAFLEDQL
jgi:hypothetical protein